MNIVMLAAGTSSRMEGRNKMLLPYRGMSMVDHSCLNALSFLDLFSQEHNEQSRLILVTGHMAEEVRTSLKNTLSFLSSHNRTELEIVFNRDYEKGQFSSVRKGLSKLSQKGPFFIALADMPLVGKDNYQVLLPLLEKHDAVRPFVKKEDGSLEPGHPVLVSSRLIPLIEEQPVYSSMREILKSCDVIKPLFTDTSWICDIDFKSDYEKLFTSL